MAAIRTDLPLTVDRLKQVLRYEPDTGNFIRLKSGNGYRAGTVAGKISDGYVVICIDKVTYMAHRLAWFYIKGVWPTDKLDHEDTRRANNIFTNLREANNFENRQNLAKAPANQSGLIGAIFIRGKNRWRSAIKVYGKKIYLGCFPSPEEAHQAYVQAKQKYHPFSPTVRTEA